MRTNSTRKTHEKKIISRFNSGDVYNPNNVRMVGGDDCPYSKDAIDNYEHFDVLLTNDVRKQLGLSLINESNE